MGGSPGMTVGLAVALVVAELYLLTRYFRRELVTGADCAADRRSELAHIMMLAAMIGMTVPPLNPLPPLGWVAVFATGIAWFGYRSWRALVGGIPWHVRRFVLPVRDLHHLIACLTMGYFVVVQPMRMPGGLSTPGLAPALVAPLPIGVLGCYFLAYSARTAYRVLRLHRAVAVPAESRTGAAARGILTSPRVLSGCHLVMALAMTHMLAVSWPSNPHNLL